MALSVLVTQIIVPKIKGNQLGVGVEKTYNRAARHKRLPVYRSLFARWSFPRNSFCADISFRQPVQLESYLSVATKKMGQDRFRIPNRLQYH